MEEEEEESVDPLSRKSRVLNPHLQVSEQLKMREPVFLPLEWFDSGVSSILL